MDLDTQNQLAHEQFERDRENEKTNIEEGCEYCYDLDELEREYPDDPHHGACLMCDECGAEYFEEYNQNIVAVNDEALKSHPELKKL